MKQFKYFLIIVTSLLLGNISLADDPVELRLPDTTATIGDFTLYIGEDWAFVRSDDWPYRIDAL